TAVGKAPAPAPRVRLDLAPRLWLAAFLATSTFYLLQTDAEQVAVGRWPLFAPWLHTSALPVFAVLSVLVALAWSAVASWLHEYERYAEDTWAQACSPGRAAPAPARYARTEIQAPPRKLFGLAFECRPPPLPA
ncbi:MAG: hypothetical protein ACTHOE_06245, partial [Conexibacter sp.]